MDKNNGNIMTVAWLKIETLTYILYICTYIHILYAKQ